MASRGRLPEPPPSSHALENRDMTTDLPRPSFLSDAWHLILPYWRSEERRSARALLAAVVVLNLGAVYVLVLLNAWNRAFYDAL